MPGVVRRSPRLQPHGDDRDHRQHHPDVGGRAGPVALQQSDHDRDRRPDHRGDRRDDAHRPDGEGGVEQEDAHRAEQRRADARQRRARRVAADEQGHRHDEDEPRGRREHQGLQRRRTPRREPAHEVGDAPHQRRDEGEERGHGDSPAHRVVDPALRLIERSSPDTGSSRLISLGLGWTRSG